MRAESYFGPPGTGKTTTVEKKMRDCVARGYNQDDIYLISFTRAAAQEIAKRAGMKPGRNISTMHSAAFRQAGVVRDNVPTNTDLRELGRKINIPITGSNPEEGEFAEVGDAYLALHNRLRAEKMYPHDIKQGYIEAQIDGALWQFEYFCRAYDQWRKTFGFIDFTDMLHLALSAEPIKGKVLFVDEAQDLSKLQWDLVDYWAQGMEEVYIAGDDDQSIYVWGGADPQGMARFTEKHNATLYVLDQSYRVPKAVHTLAQEVISNIQGPRVEKEYKCADKSGGIRQYVSPWGIQDLNHGDDVLILYRNHSMRKSAEEMLISRALPYNVQSGKPGVLQSMYTKAAYLWISITRDWEQFQAVTAPQRTLTPLIKLAHPRVQRAVKSGDLTDVAHLHWLKAVRVPADKAIYLKAIIEKYGIGVEPTISLSTIHGSKGQEADRVILINGMTDRSYESMGRDPDSEIRTFYVGVTRTRHQLDIVLDENPVPFLRVIK